MKKEAKWQEYKNDFLDWKIDIQILGKKLYKEDRKMKRKINNYIAEVKSWTSRQRGSSDIQDLILAGIILILLFLTNQKDK